MPALILFHRKWLIACDDLVIPYAIEAVLRILWLTGTSVMTWLEFSSVSSSLFIRYFLFALLGDLFLTTCLCIGISILSSRGSVLEVKKRRHLSKLLYIKCVTTLFEIAIASYTVWLLLKGPSLSFQWKSFTEALSVCLWLYVCAVIVGIFICYNSLGSSKYWNQTRASDSLKTFRKAERIWRLRLKFFCCCADVSEDKNDFIYVEISTFLATFSSDIYLAPTDILAGLITLSRKHAIEKRRSQCQLTLKSDELLEDKPIPSWMTAENAIYYLKIAKSTYGWMVFFDTLRPWKLCTLLTPSGCCKRCSDQENSTNHGDCCYCNSSAVEKITGLPESDVLYASFSNSVHEPAFIITIDHSKKAIIIAIRGTRSFSDLITDIDAEEMSFPTEISAVKLKCHRGALRSALFIYKKICDLNVLKIAFAENVSYALVLTGHSLGGSIAAILGLLLYPEYPSLQCYAYAPLAVISANGVPRTLDFVFTIVVGDDMVPRLSIHSSKDLMVQLYKSLEETQHPKYKIMLKAFGHYVKKSLGLPHKTVLTSEVYENRQVESEEPESVEHVQVDVIPNETQLYAPGRILYLKKVDGFNYSWVTGFSFQKILISPLIIRDHQPYQMRLLLEKFKAVENSDDITEAVCIRL